MTIIIRLIDAVAELMPQRQATLDVAPPSSITRRKRYRAADLKSPLFAQTEEAPRREIRYLHRRYCNSKEATKEIN
jgi:hypothetical protein